MPFAQILAVLLYQMSSLPMFPFANALHAFWAVNEVNARFSATMISQNDEAKLEAAVQRTMLALEQYKPELMDRPKIHRLVHVVESLRRNGNCNETNGAVSHAALCVCTSHRERHGANSR